MSLYGDTPDEERPFIFRGETPIGEWVVEVRETGEVDRASVIGGVRTDNTAGGPFKPREW